VYVPVVTHGRVLNRSRHVPTLQVPFDPSPGFGADFMFPQQPARPVKAEPVYWGWGGKLRPDAWNPDPQPRKSDRTPSRRRDNK
jgi:hypothetical protein